MICVVSVQFQMFHLCQRCWKDSCEKPAHFHQSTQHIVVIIRLKPHSPKLSDIIMAADARDLTVLALLDLSAASDTVDHVIILQRLQTTHHVTLNALQWFRSYLHGIYQSVLCSGERQLLFRFLMVILKVLNLDCYCSFFTHLTFIVLLQRMDYYACAMLMIPNCTFI